MLQFLYYKNVWLYLLVISSLVLLSGEVLNNRFQMHDLEVYYKTAERFVQGQELYRVKEDGHYVFKYSPTNAIYFIPFILLPFTTAKVIYWLLLTLLIIYSLNTYYSLVSGLEKKPDSVMHKNAVLLLAFLGVVTHIHREWHLGQVNLLLLALYIFVIQNITRHNFKTAAFVLAFSLFIKPFGLIFLPYLFLKKKYQILLYTGLFVILLGLLPFSFYPSLSAFKHLYVSWFRELAIELAAKQSLLTAGNHTVFSVLARYTPLKFLVLNATAARIYQVIILALIGLSLHYFIRLGRKLQYPLVAEGAVLIALIPLFAFTSMNAFLFALPCLVYLLYYFSRLPVVGKIALVAACILIGGNIRDLVGSSLFNLFENNSVYTFGMLILLVLLFYMRLNLKKAPTEL